MDPSDDVEAEKFNVLSAVEATFKTKEKVAQSEVGRIDKFKQAIRSEYYHILEQPKRLPFFLHPYLSKEREIDLTGKRSLYTPHFYLKDERNVPRRLYVNLDLQNMAFGVAGGLAVGLGTPQFFQTQPKMSVQKFLKGVEEGGVTRFDKFAAVSAITGRIVKRAVVGAILFDGLKRNMDMHRDTNDWKNAAFAGALSGAAFGLRGGLPAGVIGAAGFGVCAALYKILPEYESWGD